jgi:hypothetical protein
MNNLNLDSSIIDTIIKFIFIYIYGPIAIFINHLFSGMG